MGVTASVPFSALEACWICGGASLTPFHDVRFDLTPYQAQDQELADYTGARVLLRRCASCGFAQPDRLPSLPGFFERMYDQWWSSDWVAREFESTYKDRIFGSILDLLDARARRGRRRLLDVGAHAGRFLFLARQAGWDVEGLEINTRTASYAAGRCGSPVHQVSAARLDAIEGPFDALTMIDVLEHLPDPVSVLERASAILTDGGWIAVKVPCGPAQRLKEQVRALLRPGYAPRLADNLVHVNHFTPRSLRLALTRAGFEAIHIQVAAPELPEPAPWSNALRLAGYFIGRALPFGVHTPLALNLLACARTRRA